VFGGYLVASCALWGLHLIPRLGSSYVSSNWSDVRFDAWCLGWWPHAILHGWNPLHTGLLWAPTGVNMTLLTGLPGPSLAFAPITLAFGPIMSENLLFLLAPALAAWAGYLLCRRVTGRFWPSVAGGYVFGFSTFVAVHMAGHLNLALVFPVPLCAYLVLRRLDGSLSTRRFVWVLALVLLAEFSISTEVFATMTLVGGVTLVGCAVLGGRELRRRLLPVAAQAGVAYGFVLLVTIPYVVATLHGLSALPVTGPAGSVSESVAEAQAYQTYLQRYSVDLWSFAVPRQTQLVGAGTAAAAAARLRVGISEDVAYVGLPLLVLLAIFVTTERRRRSTWLLLAVFVCCSVLALGPALQIGGTVGRALPWVWVAKVPVLREAIPARMALFAWLALALIVSVWLASAKRSAPLRWGLTVLGVLAILPAVPPPNVAHVPAFFADGTYERYLRPGATVLAIPFYIPNASMSWQVEGGYSFRLAGGYVGFRAVPASATGDDALRALFPDRPGRITPAVLADFIATRGVEAIVVQGWDMPKWRRLLSSLPVTPQRVNGVWLYRLPPAG
jgi:hypothetical protein